MKKVQILFLAFSLVLISHSFAQFKYGPRVSIGSSSLGGGSNSFGLQLGLFINAELRDRTGIQFEVLYSKMNGVNKYTVSNSSGGSSDRKTNYTFTYINLPLYIYFPISRHITFLVGPQFNAISKATEITSGTGVPSDQSKRQSVPGTDTFIGISSGLDFNLSSPIRFGLRFSTTSGDAFKGASTFIGATMAYYMDW